MYRTQAVLKVNKKKQKNKKRCKSNFSSKQSDTYTDSRLDAINIQDVVVLNNVNSRIECSFFLYIVKETKSIIAVKNGQNANHNTSNLNSKLIQENYQQDTLRIGFLKGDF